MREFHGTITAHLPATSGEVFAFVTDLDRLPEWNRAVKRVVERPAVLTPSAEWVVIMRPKGMPSWRSRSHVEQLEPARRFAYRSHTDDDNPSFARWQWDITAADGGAEIIVCWDAYPRTVVRRFLAAPIRRRMLHGEVGASLDALRRVLIAATATSAS